MIKKNGKTEANTYLELLAKFPPRPIKSEFELNSVQGVVDSLLEKSELTEDEHDYLHILG
ncbi:transcriptional regulator, partial [filamentous cyanobacterium CCP1]